MVRKRNSIVSVIDVDTIVSSFGVTIILLRLSYRAMKGIYSAFKEGSKVIRRYAVIGQKWNNGVLDFLDPNFTT